MASKSALTPSSALKLQSRSNGSFPSKCSRKVHTISVESIAHKTRQLLATQTPTNLFPKPTNIISHSRARIDGAHEWQTATYSYNKATQKTLPVASQVTDKLLQDYMTMIHDIGSGNTGASSTARNAVALRRRNEYKQYISNSTVRDYGDKIVIDAFAFDAVAAARRELAEAGTSAAGKNSKKTNAKGGKLSIPKRIGLRPGMIAARMNRSTVSAAIGIPRVGPVRTVPGRRAPMRGGMPRNTEGSVSRSGPVRTAEGGVSRSGPVRNVEGGVSRSSPLRNVEGGVVRNNSPRSSAGVVMRNLPLRNSVGSTERGGQTQSVSVKEAMKGVVQSRPPPRAPSTATSSSSPASKSSQN